MCINDRGDVSRDSSKYSLLEIENLRKKYSFDVWIDKSITGNNNKSLFNVMRLKCNSDEYIVKSYKYITYILGDDYKIKYMHWTSFVQKLQKIIGTPIPI